MFAARNMMFGGGASILYASQFVNSEDWVSARGLSALSVDSGRLHVTTEAGNTDGAVKNLGTFVSGVYRVQITLRNIVGDPAWWLRFDDVKALNTGPNHLTWGIQLGVGGVYNFDNIVTLDSFESWFGIIVVPDTTGITEVAISDVRITAE